MSCEYLCDKCAVEHVDLPHDWLLCYERADAKYKRTINENEKPREVCGNYREKEGAE